MANTNKIEWEKFDSLINDVASMTIRADKQTRQLFSSLSGTDQINTKEFSLAFDDYTLGVVSALKGIDFLQESSKRLHSAYDSFCALESNVVNGGKKDE